MQQEKFFVRFMFKHINCRMIIWIFLILENVFNIGIYKSKNNKKIHAWLSDPIDNSLFTKGLESNNSTYF